MMTPPPRPAEESLAVGPYLMPGLLLLPLGVGATVAGAVLFPPLRGGLWAAGVGAGFVLALLVVIATFLAGGSSGARRLARRVMAVTLFPAVLLIGLGGVVVVNGVFDASDPVRHQAAARNVRRTNVDGEGTNEENILVDVDDWARPGSTLTLRFEHGEVPMTVKGVTVTTRAGALGAEWRVHSPATR